MKNLTKIILLFFILSSLTPLAPAKAASDQVRAGDLIKSQTSPAVYYYGSDNRKHAFPTITAYNSWYEDFSNIKIISSQKMNSITAGKNITMRPCTVLLKRKNSPVVYAVGLGGVLHAIDNETRAKTLFGDNWQQRIVVLPDSLWSDYTVGESINENKHPNGCLIKYADSPHIYLVYNKKKKKISSASVFHNNRFQWRNFFTIAKSISYSTEGTISAAKDYLTDTTQLTAWPGETVPSTPSTSDENGGSVTTPDHSPTPTVTSPTPQPVTPTPAPAPTPSPMPAAAEFRIGTYLICEQWQSSCDYRAGVEKIKSIGGNIVVLPIGEDLVNYPSKFITPHSWMRTNLAQEALDYAHSQGMQVYAWWGLPNATWIEKNPEWESISRDGKPAPYKRVPPHRVLDSPEYLAQIKGVIGELVGMGFDGIDINDNFQYISDTSFDDFTIAKFEREKGVTVLGNTVPEKANYIYTNLREPWFTWRASHVTELLRLMQQYVCDAGSNIPLRPHLMTHDYVYWDQGVDWKQVAGVVDTAYMMFSLDTGRITDKITEMKSYGINDIVTSLYLYEVEIGDEHKLGEAIKAVREAGGSEVAIFTYLMAEQKGLWSTLKKAVEIGVK